MELIESGVKAGAKLETGGKRTGGNYIEPTVFSNVNEDMRIGKEEVIFMDQLLLNFKFMFNR